jgi:hypothetical protein
VEGAEDGERPGPGGRLRQGSAAGAVSIDSSTLNVAGGNIHNIALNAAFLAAECGEAVGMAHLLQAARLETQKIERPLSDAEIRGWV